MKRTSVILTVIVLVVLLGVATSERAQDVLPPAKTTEQARHFTAVALLRRVNTAEVVHLSTYGSFASWQVLIARYQDYFDNFAAMAAHRQEIPNRQFADPPEIIPEWNLRLNVHSDGQGYDLMLQDIADKKCAYALFTNETAVIWESTAIDCQK